MDAPVTTGYSEELTCSVTFPRAQKDGSLPDARTNLDHPRHGDT